MEKSKYTIKYFPTFIKQLDKIFYYFVHMLNNKIAAENFYEEIFTKIERRSLNPSAYEIFKTTNKGDNWYRLRVKKFTIFYMVRNNTMEVRVILYNKRNLMN